jgi:hypothetical protein
MAIDLEQDADDQDQAETFDETHITEDGEDIAHLDMARNVYDVTSADGDADDDDFEAEDPDDFDPDDLDEAEREALLEEDDGIDDDERAMSHDQADLVLDEEDGWPSGLEGDDQSDEDADTSRDEALEATFPASDPVPSNPGAD